MREAAVRVTFHLSDPAGVIPWNATPGKACGSTLGDICNTSEVSGRRPLDLILFMFICFPSPRWRLLWFTVLPVVPPLHRGAGRRRRHRHRIGKLLMIPADNVLLKICTLPWRAYPLPRQHRLSCMSFYGLKSCPAASVPLSLCLYWGSVFYSAVEAGFFFCSVSRELEMLKKNKK